VFFRQKIRVNSIVPLFYEANLETSEQCSDCNLIVIDKALTCILVDRGRAIFTICTGLFFFLKKDNC